MKKLNLELLPAQSDFINSRVRHPAFVGGVGSGKTYAGIWRLLLKMAAQPGITCGFYGQDYLTLEDRPLAEALLAGERLGWAPNYVRGRRAIEYGKFGILRLLSFTDLKSIRSIELAHGNVDELDKYPLEDARKRWQQITMRMRATAGATLSATTTPDKGTSGFMYKAWGDNPKAQYAAYHARTIDNNHIPDLDEYVASVRDTLDERAAELYLNGEFVSIGTGMCYYRYIEGGPEVRYQAPGPEDWPEHIYIGLDFNVEACFAVVGLWNGNELDIVDEFVTRNTFDFCDELAARYRRHVPIISCDATGQARKTSATQTDVDIIRNNGFTTSIPNNNPPVMERLMSVNGAFAHGRLRVDPARTPLLDRALRDHSFDEKGEPEKFDEHPRGAGSLDDRNDALGYLVHRLLPVGRPQYATGIGIH